MLILEHGRSNLMHRTTVRRTKLSTWLVGRAAAIGRLLGPGWVAKPRADTAKPFCRATPKPPRAIGSAKDPRFVLGESSGSAKPIPPEFTRVALLEEVVSAESMVSKGSHAVRMSAVAIWRRLQLPRYLKSPC